MQHWWWTTSWILLINNTCYLHVIFCSIHSYNANDIYRQILVPFISALSHFSLPKFPLTDFLYNYYCAFYFLVALTLTPQKLQIETISDQKRQQLLQNVCCYIRLNEVCHPPIQIKKKKSLTSFYVTSDCMGCATCHFRWKIRKNLKIIRPTFMLHLTVWGVPPASSDEK